MAVVNGKHVILREELEQYRDVAVNEAVFKIAEKYNRSPLAVLQEYEEGKNAELNESIKKYADDHLDLMHEQLNKLAAECA